MSTKYIVFNGFKNNIMKKEELKDVIDECLCHFKNNTTSYTKQDLINKILNAVDLYHKSEVKILNISDFSISDSVEKLVSYIQTYLGIIYKISICDIPIEYIKNGNTKCIEITKGDKVYIDWYYNDFNVDRIMNKAERLMYRDRDMDIVTSAELQDIGGRIISALKSL